MKSLELYETIQTKLFNRLDSLDLAEVTSVINPTVCPQTRSFSTVVTLEDKDSIAACCDAYLADPKSKICILNFASYKNPGGRFRSGSLAQEEFLCYCTNLYDELIKHREYYDDNNRDLHRGLYYNRSIYSKGISVIARAPDQYLADTEIFPIDVLTCAAPNLNYYLRRGSLNQPWVRDVIESRVEYVLDVMASFDCDTLVLGAFGCGVFRNPPEMVAGAFQKIICQKYPTRFKRVIFAIPGEYSANYRVFQSILAEKLL